jgi:hypothetical protein
VKFKYKPLVLHLICDTYEVDINKDKAGITSKIPENLVHNEMALAARQLCNYEGYLLQLTTNPCFKVN